MRKVKILVGENPVGLLEEIDPGKKYIFRYEKDYSGLPVSMTMPTTQQEYSFDVFPPYFDGVLPEGVMLEALLKQRKLDRKDLFGQLIAVGHDLVGAVSVEEVE
jgi:serine/threonine-protein kinase HipA